MPLLVAWKIKFGLKIQLNAWENYRILYHKTNKEASTVLCSVVKHLGSGRALNKWGSTLDFVSCFPLHFFTLPACFTTDQSTVELLYLLIIEFVQFFFVAFFCYFVNNAARFWRMKLHEKIISFFQVEKLSRLISNPKCILPVCQIHASG